MIPRDFVTEWREHAPWTSDAQVEQDLVISRALVEIFRKDDLRGRLAFRGGTALHKLHLAPASRYSEDIDLVQIAPGPIGETIDALRAVLDPWLGEPRRQVKEGTVRLGYRFQSEDLPPRPMRLKVEINSREHFTELGHVEHAFDVRSRWFSGMAHITTYALEELLGTKLRALYQRKKGRDLFDLWLALGRGGAAPKPIVQCFVRYVRESGLRILQGEFRRNLQEKLSDPVFRADITPLLRPDTGWDFEVAARLVDDELLSLIPAR